MRNVWIVARRELGALFVQPIAYVVVIVLIFLCGLVFADGLSRYQLAQQFGQFVPPPTVANVLGFFLFLSLFVAPAITMRLLSEEHKTGTIELLMTLPVRDGEVVLGKFLAAWLFYLLMLALTLIYPLILWRFGNPDLGPILTGYLGVILAIAAMLAIGMLASALTANQIVAYMLGFGLILLLYITTIFSQSLVSNETARLIFDELSFQAHANRFPQGILAAKDVVYYVGLTIVALFAATRVMESKRWR